MVSFAFVVLTMRFPFPLSHVLAFVCFNPRSVMHIVNVRKLPSHPSQLCRSRGERIKDQLSVPPNAIRPFKIARSSRFFLLSVGISGLWVLTVLLGDASESRHRK